MKDITNELRERLRDVENQRARLQKNLERFTAVENSLKTLLGLEEERWGTQEPLLLGIKAPRPEKGKTPLSRFLLTTLKENPKSVIALTQEAQNAGLLKESKYPRRAIHFALVGMSRGGLVEKSNKVWKLKVG